MKPIALRATVASLVLLSARTRAAALPDATADYVSIRPLSVGMRANIPLLLSSDAKEGLIKSEVVAPRGDRRPTPQ